MPIESISKNAHAPIGSLVGFDDWLHDLGKTRVTGFRWRKKGLVSTVNIFGRLYIRREEIERFERRAMEGEFHRETPKPLRERTDDGAEGRAV